MHDESDKMLGMEISPRVSKHVGPRRSRIASDDTRGDKLLDVDYPSHANSRTTLDRSKIKFDGADHISEHSLTNRDRALKHALAKIQFGSAVGSEYWNDLDLKQGEESETTYMLWTPMRLALFRFVRSTSFQNGMLVVICIHICLIIYETDQGAKCFPEFTDDWESCPTRLKNIFWLYAVNVILCAIYTVEVFLLLLVLRLPYFRLVANWIELAICALGWIRILFLDKGSASAFLGWLRAVRILRVVAHPKIKQLTELHMLVGGFKGAMKAIFFGAAFLFVGLLLSSILLVQILHPQNAEIHYDNCDRCGKAYETVWASCLTIFQQTVAGDSWGQISIPNIEKDWKGAVMLPIVHLLIGLGVMNLILAVTVECAGEARKAKEDEALHEKLRESKARKTHLINLFQTLDEDNNGVLDFAEIQDAYRHSSDFRKMMRTVGLQKEDLADVFDFLDTDESGDISYLELCNALETATQREAHVLCGLVKMNVQATSRKLMTRLEGLENICGKVNSRLDGMDDVCRNMNRKIDKLLDHQRISQRVPLMEPVVRKSVDKDDRYPSVTAIVRSANRAVEAVMSPSGESTSTPFPESPREDFETPLGSPQKSKVQGIHSLGTPATPSKHNPFNDPFRLSTATVLQSTLGDLLARMCELEARIDQQMELQASMNGIIKHKLSIKRVSYHDHQQGHTNGVVGATALPFAPKSTPSNTLKGTNLII